MRLNRQRRIMQKMFSIILVLLVSLGVSSTAYTKDEKKMHQHKAHVHGEAVLNLVLEAQSVVVELQTPTMNILGFEHQPATAKQHNAVERAIRLLKDYSNVVQFTTGACRQVSVDLEVPFKDEGAHKPDADHKHEHKHEHHHDEHNDGEHQDEHASHSEFHVVYHLECSKLHTITAVDVKVFGYFPGFKTVRVQWVSANGQGMNKASQARTEVVLNP